MIKVLIVIPTLDQSGAEKQFALLASGLPKNEFDVRVVVLSRTGPLQAMLDEHAIPVDSLHKRFRLDLKAFRQLKVLIKSWQPDVVLSCLFAGNAYARLAMLGFGQKRPAMMISERCVDSWKSRWQLWCDRWLQSRTDCLVANSQSVAEFYVAQGFPDERISVIPNGVEAPPAPSISRAEFCEQYNLPHDARLVAFVGRLARQKRLKDLLWAAQLLRQSQENAYFLLIGDGPEKDSLVLYAHDVECSEHVRFLGHRHDAASLLQLVDVFWLASEFEGMSNSLMEAMSCGKPVVVSDIPPNRELVDHGKQGWLVDLGDSVGFAQYTVQLLNDPEAARAMGRAGQERMMDQFSIGQMITRYAELIREQVSLRHF